MKRQHGEEGEAWSRRPSFAPLQILTAEQLNAGFQDSHRRQLLVNRAVHGYGVVMGFGLDVSAEDGALDLRGGCLHLGEGLALDRHGRMLFWAGGRIGMDDVVGEPPDHAGDYVLVAHFAVRHPDPHDCSPCGGDDPDWSEEGVVFSLQPDDHEIDRGCPEHPWEPCVVHGEYLHRRVGGLPLGRPSVEESPDVEWFSAVPRAPRDSCRDGWDYDADPDVGVPLARVAICDLASGGPEPCEPLFGWEPGSEPDVVSVRPLVYRNPLLYELVRCCDTDLPRITSISWQAWIAAGWSKKVSWKEFEDRITSTEDGFQITFSKPVDPRTLHEASAFITAFYQDDDGSWRDYRVPLATVAPVRVKGRVMGVRLVPDSEEWVGSEVMGRRSHLKDGARIEITVRGQMIRDDCGRMLDARPVDVDDEARCQARPGGDFVSAFHVGRKPGGRKEPPRAEEVAGAERGAAAEIERA